MKARNLIIISIFILAVLSISAFAVKCGWGSPCDRNSYKTDCSDKCTCVNIHEKGTLYNAEADGKTGKYGPLRSYLEDVCSGNDPFHVYEAQFTYCMVGKTDEAYQVPEKCPSGEACFDGKCSSCAVDKSTLWGTFCTEGKCIGKYWYDCVPWANGCKKLEKKGPSSKCGAECNNIEGDTCPAPERSEGSCSYSSQCAETGTKTVTITEYRCSNYECVPTTRTETETCYRSTEGMPCSEGGIDGICQGGKCVPKCTDECSEGMTESCTASNGCEGVKNCVKGPEGCYIWGECVTELQPCPTKPSMCVRDLSECPTEPEPTPEPTPTPTPPSPKPTPTPTPAPTPQKQKIPTYYWLLPILGLSLIHI